MPRRIREVHRVISHIGVAVQTLRIRRLRHNRIRRDKSPHLRQIVPGVHVDEAQVVCPRVVVPVAGEAMVGDGRVATWHRVRVRRVSRWIRYERAEGVIPGP